MIEFRLLELVRNRPFIQAGNNSVSKASVKVGFTHNNVEHTIKIKLAVRKEHTEIVGVDQDVLRTIFASEHSGIVDQVALGADGKSQLQMFYDTCLHDYFRTLPQSIWYEKTMQIIGQLFVILSHLHIVLRVAHCDIKPDNIMVGNDGYIKLIDFDSARFIKKPASLGSCDPSSLAPELHLNEQIDDYDRRAADAFAFGICIIKLLKERGIIKNTMAYIHKASIAPNETKEAYAARMAYLQSLSIREELRAVFAKDNICEPYENVSFLHVFLEKMMSIDWKLRLDFLRVAELHHRNKKLSEFRLFEPRTSFLDLFRTHETCLLNKQIEIHALSSEKARLKKVVTSTPTGTPKYESLKNELDCTKGMTSFSKYEELYLKLTMLMPEKNDKGLTALVDGKKTWGMSRVECGMREFKKFLLLLMLNDKELMNRIFTSVDSKTVDSYDQNYPFRYVFRPGALSSGLHFMTTSPSQLKRIEDLDAETPDYHSCDSRSSSSSGSGSDQELEEMTTIRPG